jgi:hypothetical protein
MANDKSFQNLRIDPATNPAILDTATWDPDAAWQTITQVGESWSAAHAALRMGNQWVGLPQILLEVSSVVHHGAATFFLTGLPDGRIERTGRSTGSEAAGERPHRCRLPSECLCSGPVLPVAGPA